MRIPRWTTYPALAALIALAVLALPEPVDDEFGGTALAIRSGEARVLKPSDHERVVVLGIDGLDPDILVEAVERFPDRMSNFAALIEQGTLMPLGTSTPPQSPVAWSNFITGRDPAGHGIFDFIHRDPVTRGPVTSTTKSEPVKNYRLWGQWKFPLGGDTESSRTGEAFWTILARNGVPADIWRMPANFPVEPAEGVSFSGMMTPALDSAYGEFTFYTTDPPTSRYASGQKIIPVQSFNGRIKTSLSGPPNSFRFEGDTEHDEILRIPITIYIDEESGAAAVDTGTSVVVLEPGEWSDFANVTFSMLPMSMMDVSGIVRFYLRSIAPEFEMYASAVNIDPSSPVTPVAEPSSASADLASRDDGGIGPYYTQGMPEDVGALKSEVLRVPEFMEQADLVHKEGERMLDYALDRYLANDAGGLLFFYFSTVDLCSHMMWRHHDDAHPHHDPVIAAEDSSAWSRRPGSTWHDTVFDLYMHMDEVLGHLRARIGDDTKLYVMSDHGFAPYARKFSLNTWLYDEGYLVLKEGMEKELPWDDPERSDVFLFAAADWSKTRAYGIGFNGLYLNLAGRELDDPETETDESGIVQPGSEAEILLAELKSKLEAIRDEDGTQVVLRADLATDAYKGDRVDEAPDILVGYNAGYGNSDESTQGQIPHEVLADNLGGTFNGSHLMAPEVVAGTLLTNAPVDAGDHKLEDLTVEILRIYGIEPPKEMTGRALSQ